MKKLSIILFLIFLSPYAYATDLEEIEQKARIEKIFSTLNELDLLAEQISTQKTLECIKSFGNTKFCDCLVNNLPIDLGFKPYIIIVTISKDKLGYDTLTETDKAQVDMAYSARNECVKKMGFK